MIYQGSAMVPGACGEFVQGVLGGKNFLVTCPVNCFSRATVTISPTNKQIKCPQGLAKTAQAVRLMLDELGYPGFGAFIKVSSKLPVSKGMASSTADLTAACYAVGEAMKVTAEPRLIAGIALKIEPSDGTFYRGITLIDHVHGRLLETIGKPVAMGILAVDFGGVVDTLEFNRRADLPFLNRRKEPDTGRALELVRKGLQSEDPYLVGEGATLSALANQRILCKPRLEELIALARSLGAYGVNVAHSGTVVGILLPPGRERDQKLINRIAGEFPELKYFYPLRLTCGGPRYLGHIETVRGEADDQTTWRQSQSDGETIQA